MSFVTIVLCDLYNTTKRIFVVNVIYDWKLVANINLLLLLFTSEKPQTMVTKQPHCVRHVKNNVEKRRKLITCDHAIVNNIIEISIPLKILKN
jgi:hypothetical protein